MKNIKELGKILSFNDEPQIDVYDGDSCNEIRGTDSTIFHPFLSNTDKLWAFTPDMYVFLHFIRRVGKALQKRGFYVI